MRDEKGRYLKGTSGNKNGRPKKGTAMTDVLASMVDKEAIAAKLLELASKGDVAALKYVYDRIDGTPTQTIKGDGAEPLTFVIRKAKDQEFEEDEDRNSD
jgi:hypothetical protein